MTHAYSNAIMDKVEEAVMNGIVGNKTTIGDFYEPKAQKQHLKICFCAIFCIFFAREFGQAERNAYLCSENRLLANI